MSLRKKIIITILAIFIVSCISAGYSLPTDSNSMKEYDFEFFTMDIPSDVNIVESQPYSQIVQYMYEDKAKKFSVICVDKETPDYTVTNVKVNQSWVFKERFNNDITIYQGKKDGADDYIAFFEKNDFYASIHYGNLNDLKDMLKTIEFKNNI